MMSHALSKRRGFKPRPDVCKTHENPGRCDPPPPPPPDFPPRTCKLSTSHDEEGYPGEHGDYEIAACCEALPLLEVVDVVITFPDGVVDSPTTVKNCDEEDEDGDFWNPDEPGVYTMSATFTWSDSGTCVAVDTVTCIPEDDDDNDD